MYIFVLVALVFLGAAATKSFKFKEAPPGTLPLFDSLFIDRQPVRVVDYLEFLSAIRNSYSPLVRDSLKKFPSWGLNTSRYQELLDKTRWDSLYYLRMLPRTWTTYANDIKKYDVDYHIKNPSYYPYPVINLSYVQVVEYCRWRTDMVKLYYAMKCATEKKRRRYPMNFIYRLPKRDEWDKAIGKYFGNIKRDTILREDTEKLIKNLAKPYSNKKGFQYQSDNVGEMLDGFLVAVGFAWDDNLHLGSIKYMIWEEPVDWIGFRCVCEIIPENGKKNKSTKPKVVRDRFGKVISMPEKSTKKKKKLNSDNTSPKKNKSKKVKKSGVKNRPESMKKKRRKNG